MPDPVTDDRLPDYQRAVVAFVRLQIAHLDDQRERLVDALELLGGPAAKPLVDLLDQLPRPVKAAVDAQAQQPPAALPPRTPHRPGFMAPKGDRAVDRITAYLAARGPTRTCDIVAGTGFSSQTVYKVLTDGRGRFSSTGSYHTRTWTLNPDWVDPCSNASSSPTSKDMPNSDCNSAPG